MQEPKENQMLELSYHSYVVGWVSIGTFTPADNDDVYVNAAALKEIAA
jgi:hypothetical protein